MNERYCDFIVIIIGLSACIVSDDRHGALYGVTLLLRYNSQRAHKRLVNVFITFTIPFRICSECPFIERLVLVKTFS